MRHLKFFENSNNELEDIKDILQKIGETAPIVIKHPIGSDTEIPESYVVKFENTVINPTSEELANINLHLNSIGWEIICTENFKKKNEYMFFLMKSDIISQYKKIGLKLGFFKSGFTSIKIGDEEITIEISDRSIIVTLSDENLLFRFNSKILCSYFIIQKQIKYLGIKSYFDRKF